MWRNQASTTRQERSGKHSRAVAAVGRVAGSTAQRQRLAQRRRLPAAPPQRDRRTSCQWRSNHCHVVRAPLRKKALAKKEAPLPTHPPTPARGDATGVSLSSRPGNRSSSAHAPVKVLAVAVAHVVLGLLRLLEDVVRVVPLDVRVHNGDHAPPARRQVVLHGDRVREEPRVPRQVPARMHRGERRARGESGVGNGAWGASARSGTAALPVADIMGAACGGAGAGCSCAALCCALTHSFLRCPLPPSAPLTPPLATDALPRRPLTLPSPSTPALTACRWCAQCPATARRTGCPTGQSRRPPP